jgi:putative ATP-binding cassette transporter
VILPTGREGAIGDQQIATLLKGLDLEGVLERVSGLDVERDWDDVLSLGEQRLLSVARIVLAAPSFVFLERPHATLGAAHAARVLSLLRERSITYLTLGDGGDRMDDHDFILELANDGGRTWKALTTEGEVSERALNVPAPPQ